MGPRKLLTVIIPIVLAGIVAYSGIVDFEYPIIGLGAVSLFIQSITFYVFFGDEISEYSENLADKFVPQTLQSYFGATVTTLIIFFASYFIGFIVLIGLVILGWNPDETITKLLTIFCIGSILNPIIQSIIDADDGNQVSESGVALTLYALMILLSIAGLSNLDKSFGRFAAITDEIEMLFFISAFIFAKANYILDRAFKQYPITHLALPIIIPAFFFLSPSIEFLEKWF